MNCNPRSYVGHLELPEQMIERLDGRVLGRMLCVDARGDRVDHEVVVGARKEGNRETGRGSRGQLITRWTVERHRPLVQTS